MFRRNALPSLALALPVLAGLAGCSSVSGVFGGKDKAGPGKVDDLLGRIEQVHVECELAQRAALESLQVLQAMVSPSFGGDALAAFDGFVTSIDASEERAKELDKAVTSMKKTAGPFFESWAASMSEYTNVQMRLRSQNRLTETHARYEAIVAAVEPAQGSLKAFNSGLRDHELYLSNDFNAAAVAELAEDASALAGHADQLDKLFDRAREATEEYVKSNALRGQLTDKPRRRGKSPTPPADEQS